MLSASLNKTFPSSFLLVGTDSEHFRHAVSMSLTVQSEVSPLQGIKTVGPCNKLSFLGMGTDA